MELIKVINTKLRIERAMEFKFKDLKLIGYVKNCEEEMIFIKKYNGNWIHEIVINGERYEYHTNKKIIINSDSCMEILSDWPREMIKIDENYKLFVNEADMVAAIMIGNYLEDEIINSIGDD